MAITLGDAFQNWNPDTKLATGGAKVDGGVIAMLEPNIFRNKVMLPGVTFATDVEIGRASCRERVFTGV